MPQMKESEFLMITAITILVGALALTIALTPIVFAMRLNAKDALRGHVHSEHAEDQLATDQLPTRQRSSVLTG